MEQLYDLHADLMYGTVVRLADGPCAEEAFYDACVELWGTEAKRAIPHSTAHMVRICIAKSRERCAKANTIAAFEGRLKTMVIELRSRRAESMVIVVQTRSSMPGSPDHATGSRTIAPYDTLGEASRLD